MDWARVRGATADGASLELGPVLRATTASNARHLQPSEMRAAAGQQIVDGAAQVPVQPPSLRRFERSGSTGGIETRSPQDLVDEQVAESGHAVLIHQPSLQRRRAVIERRAQLC